MIANCSHLQRATRPTDQPSTLTDAGTVAYYATLGDSLDRDRDQLLIMARSSITLNDNEVLNQTI